jgi:hypothetical protein
MTDMANTIANLQPREPFEALRYALRALQREIVSFSFEYPLDIVPEAGPKGSLHYYLYSEKLTWSMMVMDPTGVPQARNRLAGLFYKPAYIAWWGLVNLGHFLRHQDEPSRTAFLRQIDWLEENAVVRSDGCVVWPNNHDKLEAKTLLKAPWVSSYDQGLAISALVRGYRLTKRPHLLELLQGSARIFEINVEDGGVREPLRSGAIYSEIPGQSVPGILDGFMSSLLGIYDLFVETGDPAAGRLFSDGIEGLKSMLPTWDYRRRWSWYSSREYLCPPGYHWLNRVLLEVLGRLSAEPLLSEYAEAWKPQHLSALGRAEIFLGILVTKNACRIRNRTWSMSRAKLRALASRPTNPTPQKEDATQQLGKDALESRAEPSI